MIRIGALETTAVEQAAKLSDIDKTMSAMGCVGGSVMPVDHKTGTPTEATAAVDRSRRQRSMRGLAMMEPVNVEASSIRTETLGEGHCTEGD